MGASASVLSARCSHELIEMIILLKSVTLVGETGTLVDIVGMNFPIVVMVVMGIRILL